MARGGHSHGMGHGHPVLRALTENESWVVGAVVARPGSSLDDLVGAAEHMPPRWVGWAALDLVAKGVLELRLRPAEDGLGYFLVPHYLVRDGKGAIAYYDDGEEQSGPDRYDIARGRT